MTYSCGTLTVHLPSTLLSTKFALTNLQIEVTYLVGRYMLHWLYLQALDQWFSNFFFPQNHIVYCTALISYIAWHKLHLKQITSWIKLQTFVFSQT